VRGNKSTNLDVPSTDHAGVYDLRFGEREQKSKERIWYELGRYLQRKYVPEGGRVLDIATDRGYFIRNVSAAERWATDLRDTSSSLPSIVRFVKADGLTLADALPTDYFDLVFMSNYLEHLDSAESVIQQFRVAHRLLKVGGRVLVLQPNIKLVGQAYWDFIDHKVPLTEDSLVEAATLAGFKTRELIRRFLPYSTKGRLPVNAALIRAYLAFRPAWWLLGKQTLYLGERAPDR
jgi:SAM-dependent methyltransferase